MRLVVALGGNALSRRGERLDAAHQEQRVARAAEQLAPLAERHELVVTHGNGPQVGWLAEGGAPRSLDALDAETEGLIGYWIERELASRLPHHDVVTLLTRVEVDADDPAFARPEKPIGPVVDDATAQRLARERGWSLAPDGGGQRRVVPSPAPRAIPAASAARLLVESGRVVVCAGGGGIPVVRRANGVQLGVEAVVDKDLTSALLAVLLRADAMLLLTDVGGVFPEWPARDEAPLRRLDPAAARALVLDAGSMRPKVEAACRFVEAGGAFACIGALEEAERILAGEAGTRVSTPDGEAPP